MARLDLSKRAALSTALKSARERKRWSQEEASERATEALHRHAASRPEGASPDELAVFARLEITRRHVVALENCPSAPMATVERRARLLGLALALELDLGPINRLAGAL
jgi:hypothetical protein